MRNHTFALLALAAFGAGPAFATELTITIEGVKKPGGNLLIAVMTEAAWDDKEKPLLTRSVPVQEAAKGDRKVTVKFEDLAEGSYAVGVIHDENGNMKLDTGVMKIPTESWGNSNNPKVWRKPYFSEVKVDVGATPVAIVIQMH
jgi:uncharacterized protein (DUF2141 family)